MRLEKLAKKRERWQRYFCVLLFCFFLSSLFEFFLFFLFLFILSFSALLFFWCLDHKKANTRPRRRKKREQAKSVSLFFEWTKQNERNGSWCAFFMFLLCSFILSVKSEIYFGLRFLHSFYIFTFHFWSDFKRVGCGYRRRAVFFFVFSVIPIHFRPQWFKFHRRIMSKKTRLRKKKWSNLWLIRTAQQHV